MSDIFLVDDEFSVLKLGSATLARVGHTLFTFESGAQAIAAAPALTPDAARGAATVSTGTPFSSR